MHSKRPDEEISTLQLAADREGAAGPSIRAFCLQMIRQVYGTGYTPAWHADLDSLLLPDADNWFSPENGGSLRFVRSAEEEIIAAGGLYGLSRKPATAGRLAERYNTPDEVCQIARVYLAPSIRGKGLGRRIVAQLEVDAIALGYRTAYLHADARSLRALEFWQSCAWQEFGRFSYPATGGTEICVDFDKTL